MKIKTLSFLSFFFVFQILPVSAENLIKADLAFKPDAIGKPIAGIKVLPGSPLVWQATPNVVAVATKAVSGLGVADTRSHGFLSRVPINGTPETISLQAEIRLAEVPHDKSGWISVGIGNSTMGPSNLNISWGEGIFLLADTRGMFQCVYNPSASDHQQAVQFRSGMIEDFMVDGWITLGLDYNRAKNTVTMTVNGKTVLKNFALESRGFTPNPFTAGVSGYGIEAQQVNIKGFSLKY